MSLSIGSATAIQAPAPVQAAPASKPAAAAARPPVAAAQNSIKDTVQISAAAQVLQEAIENPAQTAREANAGDQQARRLLAKEQADQATK